MKTIKIFKIISKNKKIKKIKCLPLKTKTNF